MGFGRTVLSEGAGRLMLRFLVRWDLGWRFVQYETGKDFFFFFREKEAKTRATRSFRQIPSFARVPERPRTIS